MLYNLLSMGTEADFIYYSLLLRKVENRCTLYEEIQKSGATMRSADRWTPEYLDDLLGRLDFESVVNDVINREERAAEILHRLQLLGYVAPVISDYINNFLNKACL